MLGKESVRLGLATHYFMSRDVAQVIFTLKITKQIFVQTEKPILQNCENDIFVSGLQHT